MGSDKPRHMEAAELERHQTYKLRRDLQLDSHTKQWPILHNSRGTWGDGAYVVFENMEQFIAP